jgi:TolA-binding protein
MKIVRRVAMAGLIIAALAVPARAQQSTTVTQADVQRLQDNIYLAERDIQQARNRDAARATQLTSELDDLRDEVIYLKVKLRKERTLARSEWADVRDRIDDLRSRARGETATSSAAPTSTSSSAASTVSSAVAPASAPAAAVAASRPAAAAPASSGASTTAANGSSIEIPSGTELDVRLQAPINSGTAQVEDRFEATTLVDVNASGKTVIPAGSVVRGVVTAVEPATRTNRTAKMTVSFDQVTVNGRAYPIRGTVTQAIQGEGIKGETGRIATGAGVGAILGGLIGGFKGALIGVLVGGGGITAATEGKEVELPQGAVLRVRLDSPVQIQTAR